MFVIATAFTSRYFSAETKKTMSIALGAGFRPPPSQVIIFRSCSFGGGYVKFLYRDDIDAVEFQKGPQKFFKFLAGLQV